MSWLVIESFYVISIFSEALAAKAARRDRNPGDNKTAQLPDFWFLLDEFAQSGPIAAEFFPLLEVGRSLGLRAMIGMQNFQQLLRINNPQAAAELLQLVGNLIAFRMNPGPDSPPEVALFPPQLEWSTTMVHSEPTRPPWLLAKLLQASGF
jgi:hypothetical protein